MKKELSLVILINLLIIGLNANAKINQNELVKSLFLQEVHILSAIEDEVNIENFYNYFDFRMTAIGHDSGNINIYEVDSFSYKQERLTAIHDTCKYFVAIYNNQEVYRLKGFSANDFPFFFKTYIELYGDDDSANEILDDLSLFYCKDVLGEVLLDFNCMYNAFRSKEINYDEHPCLQSYEVASRVYLVAGYNGKYARKVGGEPLGYRGKKIDKKYIICPSYKKGK